MTPTPSHRPEVRKNYSIPKISDVLDATGSQTRPAVVVATAGTTMTEAVDSTARIAQILDRHGVRDRHIHVDTALSGTPLALVCSMPGLTKNIIAFVRDLGEVAPKTTGSKGCVSI